MCVDLDFFVCFVSVYPYFLSEQSLSSNGTLFSFRSFEFLAANRERDQTRADQLNFFLFLHLFFLHIKTNSFCRFFTEIKKAWLPFTKNFSRNRKSPVSRKKVEISKKSDQFKPRKDTDRYRNVRTSQRWYHHWKFCFMGWTSSRFRFRIRRRSLYPCQGRFLKHRSLEFT